MIMLSFILALGGFATWLMVPNGEAFGNLLGVIFRCALVLWLLVIFPALVLVKIY